MLLAGHAFRKLAVSLTPKRLHYLLNRARQRFQEAVQGASVQLLKNTCHATQFVPVSWMGMQDN